MTQTEMTALVCPECQAEIAVAATIQKGEVVSCPDCGSDLEVTKTEPLEAKKAPEAQEDWGE
jgi:alpha-aminoadipate/glutamate carrier protein LysW